MKLKSLALAAFAVTSFGAQAALVTYAPWDAAYAANGLSGVLFDVNTANGVTVIMGAHAYKNGASLDNNGVDTFTAQSGLYAPDGKNYANWSFDFGWDLGTGCTGCTVKLSVDTDASSGVNLVTLFQSAVGQTPAVYLESWNMEMGFMPGALGGYDFDPFAATSTAFRIEVLNANGAVVTASNVTVNVPEPGSLALAGLALAGLGFARRRRA